MRVGERCSETKVGDKLSMGIVLLYSFVHHQDVSSFRLSLVPLREKYDLYCGCCALWMCCTL